jgi:DNA recombination protein Rad52
MTFTDRQMRRLRARLPRRHVREREADGVTLQYLEGWHVIAEANRIFGFDGWDRETVASHCVWTKQLGSRFAAAYVIRVRITVRAGEVRIAREGSGAGEATAITPGQAHELAAKAAETDATKRALSTFGNAFGLSLYGGSIEAPLQPRDATGRFNGGDRAARPVPLTPDPGAAGSSIDKSQLQRAEPKRLRDSAHLKFVTTQPCLICGRQPSHAHHLTFAQARALGRKVSDEFAVPLCNLHHRELHDHGNERTWWLDKRLNPLPVATALWNESHGWSSGTPVNSSPLQNYPDNAVEDPA